jgi:uncharacterized protein
VNIRKIIWFTAGILLLTVAYIGIVVPGIPWSTPTVAAAYCFARSSDRMHRWLYSHKLFGPFLINWQEKKIFPIHLKYFMLLSMAASLLVLWFTTNSLNAVLATGVFMLLVVGWAWRYPSSIEEHDKRVKLGKRVAWLK